MTNSRKMQSALRAALKNEDVALEQRLPDTGKAAKPAAAKPAAAKTVSRRAPAKMQAQAVKPVTSAPEAAVAPPVEVSLRPVAPPKAESRVRETFSLGRSDIDRLAALKARGGKSGSKYGRSVMVRAGLLLLEAQDAAQVSALIEQLPGFKKSKRKKK